MQLKVEVQWLTRVRLLHGETEHCEAEARQSYRALRSNQGGIEKYWQMKRWSGFLQLSLVPVTLLRLGEGIMSQADTRFSDW